MYDVLLARDIWYNRTFKSSNRTIRDDCILYNAYLTSLGAPGVSAHEVTKHSGFKVIYGPVRAKDLKEFIRAGMKATAEMRTVRFSTYDRLVLTPVELVNMLKTSLMIFGILFLLNLMGLGPFGFVDIYGYIGAVIVGGVLTPVLLPWIPGRAFAWKGWLLGLIWAVLVNGLNGWPFAPQYSLLRAHGYLFIFPSVSAYLAMNFTGSSTFTSFSGVLKEMKIAIPLMIITIFLGCVLILINSFIHDQPPLRLTLLKHKSIRGLLLPNRKLQRNDLCGEDEISGAKSWISQLNFRNKCDSST